jgi:hypothetical protein
MGFPSESRLDETAAPMEEEDDLAITGSLRSEHAVKFCKEPSPSGRGGKMLEETPLEYAHLLHLIGN